MDMDVFLPGFGLNELAVDSVTIVYLCGVCRRVENSFKLAIIETPFIFGIFLPLAYEYGYYDLPVIMFIFNITSWVLVLLHLC